MGYETRFELTICPKVDEVPDALFVFLRDAVAFEGDVKQHLSHDQDVFEFVSKWRDYDKDMLAFSNRFPGVFFKLHGAGEDQGDLWDHYYLGGRIQRCPAQITYEPFDPRKLKLAEELVAR
jgi:hypothetical protein